MLILIKFQIFVTWAFESSCSSTGDFLWSVEAEGWLLWFDCGLLPPVMLWIWVWMMFSRFWATKNKRLQYKYCCFGLQRELQMSQNKTDSQPRKKMFFSLCYSLVNLISKWISIKLKQVMSKLTIQQ